MLLLSFGLCLMAPSSVLAQGIGGDVARQTAVGAAVQAVGADSFANTRVDFPAGVVGYPDVTYESWPDIGRSSSICSFRRRALSGTVRDR